MFTETQQNTINEAISILEGSLVREAYSVTSPKDAATYCRLRIGAYEHEVFAVLFLDSQHQLIACEELFRGTIAESAVYPREIAKRALQLNAAAVVLTHNHPSGKAEPSTADIRVTNRITSALELLEIRVLDHIVATAIDYTSFAERGLL